MTRGNNQQIVFHKPQDYKFYLSLIARFKIELPFDLYHYCLMPNHTHFLVRTRDAEGFARFMKKLNLAYFSHYAQKYGWSGHLWQDRYKSQPVGKDAYFIQCGKYIELNPVRAELVKKPENYLYSSYRYYSLGEPNDLLSEDLFYPELANTSQKRYKAYQELVISDIILNSYPKPAWGSRPQRKNEQRKTAYHIKKKHFH